MAARPPPQPLNTGITIRGLAGPFVVIAQNLAPGTTAGDLESAMMPVGGLVSKCRIIKTHPIVIAEIEFQTKEGADRVIERFNNQLVRTRIMSRSKRLALERHDTDAYSRPTDGFYTSMPRSEARQQAPPEELLALRPHRETVSSLMAPWGLSPCRWRKAAARDCTVMIL